MCSCLFSVSVATGRVQSLSSVMLLISPRLMFQTTIITFLGNSGGVWIPKCLFSQCSSH